MKNDSTAGSGCPDTTCYALFIGGIADGERHKDNGDKWQRLQRAKYSPKNSYCKDPMGLQAEIVSSIYRRELIFGSKERMSVFVEEGMDMDEAIQRLLRFYSPHNSQADQP